MNKIFILGIIFSLFLITNRVRNPIFYFIKLFPFYKYKLDILDKREYLCHYHIFKLYLNVKRWLLNKNRDCGLVSNVSNVYVCDHIVCLLILFVLKALIDFIFYFEVFYILSISNLLWIHAKGCRNKLSRSWSCKELDTYIRSILKYQCQWFELYKIIGSGEQWWLLLDTKWNCSECHKLS